MNQNFRKRLPRYSERMYLTQIEEKPKGMKIRRSLFAGFLDERRKEMKMTDKIFSGRKPPKKRFRMSTTNSYAASSAAYDEMDGDLSLTIEETLRREAIFPCLIKLETMQGKSLQYLVTTSQHIIKETA